MNMGNYLRMIISTPAKINLYLSVLGKRPDGFHELETLMTAVSIYDRLTIEPRSTGISFETNRPFGPPEDDLCYRAAALFFANHSCGKGVALSLEKTIPDGAGLGGGSSDAAAVLVGLEKLYGPARLSVDEMAAQLGSDINFFIQAGSAWCYGRGEQIEIVADAPQLWAAIVFPKIHTPTPSVFKQLALTQWTGTARLDARQRREFFAKPTFSNDLEQAALEYKDELKSCRENLCDLFPNNHVVLSGSGSSFFVMCNNQKEAQKTVAELERKWEWPVFLVETNKQMIINNDARQGVCE